MPYVPTPIDERYTPPPELWTDAALIERAERYAAEWDYLPGSRTAIVLRELARRLADVKWPASGAGRA